MKLRDLSAVAVFLATQAAAIASRVAGWRPGGGETWRPGTPQFGRKKQKQPKFRPHVDNGKWLMKAHRHKANRKGGK